MAEIEAPRSASLKALQSRQDSIRRARPPDIDALKQDENRVPLREDRMAKRESKLNLRGLFGRSKTANKTVRGTESTTSLRELSRSGKRISLAEIGNWPYGPQGPRSEISLSSPPSTASSSSPASLRQLQRPYGIAESDTQQVPRGSTAIPLFQAYPQAIKHGTLPCCTTPVESLLRLHTTKGSPPNKVEPSQSATTLDSVDEVGSDKRAEVTRKKAKGSLEWKNKIYVLATSGYLLQYAAEGPFNRLPEKALQLTKDSAVFASDLLPGRHFVLQVASSMDANGNSTSEAKSRMSKLAFRNNARRQAANFLLIFETPESMDSWLATLRKAIQSLGGKKKLSETGKLDAEDDSPESKLRQNRRTLVVRDPKRFSQVLSPDSPITPETSPSETTDPGICGPLPQRVSDVAQDDVSSRLSMISSDGQQLENLRNSNHRLSIMSSGQRTAFTSSESSPACSPTRASFSSNRDDHAAYTVHHPAHEHQPSLSSLPEVRLRPNATAILNRRQSMQTMMPGFDGTYEGMARPQSSLSTITDTSNQGAEQHSVPSSPPASPPIVPNFSVPQGSSRRFSTAASPPRDNVPSREVPSRLLRRSPPPVLGISRPLSIVVDQSPISPLPSNPHVRFPSPSREGISSLPTHSGIAPPRMQDMSRSTSRHNLQNRPKRSSLLSPPPSNGNSPRKYSSTGNLRDNRKQLPLSQVEKSAIALSQVTSQAQVEAKGASFAQRVAPYPTSRSSSSMDDYGSPRSLSATTSPKFRNKRASFVADKPSFQYSLNSYVANPVYNVPLMEEPDTINPPRRWDERSVSSIRASRVPSRQHLPVDPQVKALLTSRSMPHLDGPPPLPPPNRALPAIPKKGKPEISVNTSPRAVRV